MIGLSAWLCECSSTCKRRDGCGAAVLCLIRSDSNHEIVDTLPHLRDFDRVPLSKQVLGYLHIWKCVRNVLAYLQAVMVMYLAGVDKRTRAGMCVCEHANDVICARLMVRVLHTCKKECMPSIRMMNSGVGCHLLCCRPQWHLYHLEVVEENHSN